MKKLSLLFFILMLGMGAFAQTTYHWRSEATNGNWNDANNWWNGSTTAIPPGGEILSFGNDVQTTMTHDLTSNTRHQIIFTNSATQSRIITGTTENIFYNHGTNNSKIENNSSANQTIDFPLKWGSNPMELNPVSGDLTFTKAINNNGIWTDVWSGNGKTLSIASMSGTGGLTIKNNPTTVKITGTSTYTGNTYVDYGTLELQADLSSEEIIVADGAKLIINGNDVDVQKLTINSGGTVEVLPGKSLTVNGVLTNNGILTLKSDATGTASILAPGSSDISGTFKVQQYLSSARNWYISSPVAGATVPTGYNYFGYQEPGNNASRAVSGETDYWKAYTATTSLEVGKGYIAQPTGATTIEFSGTTLNNADKSITLSRTVGKTKEGFNLVGNPYPSYITWLESTATAAKVEPSIWYRTHNGSGYEFQTYNAPSGVGVPSSASGYIPPMQAFWVRVIPTETSGTLTFTNALRLHNDGTFSSLKAPAAKNSDRQLIRLQVSNGSTSDELVVYSNANASNGFDAYDSPKMLNGSTSAVPDMYTTAGSEKLVINGLNTLPLDVVIPVSFAANNASATSFTISANEISNLPSGVTVKIIDKSVETSLSDGGTYTFTADAGTTKTFGLILRSPGAVTGVENGKADNFSVYANTNGQLVIMAPVKSNYAVYNAVGQLIQNGKLNSEHETLNTKLSSGVYVVKIENHSTRVIVK